MGFEAVFYGLAFICPRCGGRIESNLVDNWHIEAEAINNPAEGRRLEELQWIAHHRVDELLVQMTSRVTSS